MQYLLSRKPTRAVWIKTRTDVNIWYLLPHVPRSPYLLGHVFYMLDLVGALGMFPFVFALTKALVSSSIMILKQTLTSQYYNYK
jgi:hypothetical protein